MQNTKNDPLSLSFESKDAVFLENKLLLAATVAAVVLAGSAIAYRRAATHSDSTRRLFRKDPQPCEEKLGSEKNVEDTLNPGAMLDLPTASTSYATGQVLEYNGTSTTKTSRSKDRRKRGKDPLKEVLKSGKKLKSFPITTGSSSRPPSPMPSAAILSSSPAGKRTQVDENSDLYSAFEIGSSSVALQTQITDPSQDFPDSPRRQREKSPSILTNSTSAAHSRAASELSQVSRFNQDGDDDHLAGDDDADFPGTSGCKEYAHPHLQPQNSLTGSSSRPPSSLADISEPEAEEGGWLTSVSKPRLRHRARLPEVMFEDLHSGAGDQSRDRPENRAEEEGITKRKAKTRGYSEQVPEATECHPNATSIIEGGSVFPQSNGAPVVFPSTGLPLPASGPITDSEKNKFKTRRQERQQDPQDPSHCDTAATPVQATASSSSNARFGIMNSNESLNADTADKVQDESEVEKRQAKGGSGMNYASFSSAVARGGGGRMLSSQSRTVSVSGSRFTEIDNDVSGAFLPASAGAEDGETEISFPTLNSQARPSSSGPSTRPRSIGASVNSSSPSKKNKRFSASKSGTPPPNALPSRTSSPSNIRENHAATHIQGLNPGGSSSMPALSAQTQLASLRGALEAARLREEKHKAEMEKVMKEMETLKWESTNHRRGEVELQAQVRQLTHQLQSYAALFASVTHLNPHFTVQLPVLQLHPQLDTDENAHSESKPDPGSSPKVDPTVELPNGGVGPSASEKLEPQPMEAQEEAVPSSDQPHLSQTQQPPSPISSPVQQHVPPLPSATIPFFPYPVSPYLPTQHPHFSAHPSPWMYHHYQPQSTQNLSGSATSPVPPHHYPSVYSPVMYPISPVAPPLSPQSAGMVSHQLVHQHQSFGFGGGRRSTGASSAGSHSPELIGPTSGLHKQKSRMRRRKSQMANLNGNARTCWEDVGDGWVGLGRVGTEPPGIPVDKARKVADEEIVADEEGDEEDVESASGPYSELLADAILKRSSTIRPSKKRDSSPPDRQEGHDEAEPFTEFTFPSLSDFSNVYYRTASRTESSISSSLSSSPPSTTATVPDFVGDPKEDKASLPPVIEKAEDSDPSVVEEGRLDTALSRIQDIGVNEQATPEKDEHERSLTVSELEQ